MLLQVEDSTTVVVAFYLNGWPWPRQHWLQLLLHEVDSDSSWPEEGGGGAQAVAVLT